jgi:uncharacterized membrane protein
VGSDRPIEEAEHSNESHKWQLVSFVIGHILIFAAVFHSIYSIQYSPVGLYFDYAAKVLHGSLPYRDFSLEYPPFALVFFVLPKLFSSTWQMFAVYFQIEVVIFDIIGLWLIYLIARREAKAPWKLLSVYTIAILAIGPITGQQYDIFPAVLTLLALYFFWRDKTALAWIFLALGTTTKIYPAAIAPIFLVYYLRNRDYHKIRTGIISFAAVSLLILLPFLITGPANLLSLYNYHAERGVQLESSYASFLEMADKLGLIHVSTQFTFGSWNLTGRAANFLAAASTPLLLILLLGLYWLVYRRADTGKIDIGSLGICSLLAIVITLITSKILSPQYLIWLIPLLPLVTGRVRFWIWGIFAAVGVLTYYLFPIAYYDLIDLNTNAVAALAARNVLLILMAFLLLGILLGKQPSKDADRWTPAVLSSGQKLRPGRPRKAASKPE